MKLFKISATSLFGFFMFVSSSAFAEEFVFFNCTLTNYYSSLYKVLQVGRDASFGDLSKHCKVVIEDSLEWPEYVNDLKMHTYEDIGELQIEEYYDSKTSVIYRCPLAEQKKCSPYLLSLEEDKTVQFYQKMYEQQKNALEKRKKYFDSMLKNSKNALTYRRMLLSSQFQQRFLHDKGLFEKFAEFENIGSIDQSSLKLGIIRSYHRRSQHRLTKAEQYQKVKEMMNQKEIYPLEYFFKHSYEIDHWFDEVVTSPQLALYSPKLTTSSAGYLLMSADPGKGLYVVLEDKTCIYVDSYNELHVFNGWMSKSRPVVVYDARDNYYWSILPFSENDQSRYVEILDELRQRLAGSELMSFIDIEKTGFPATAMFKTAFLEEQKQSENITQDLFKVLVARERGSVDRVQNIKEFFVSGLYNSLLDPMLYNMFIESCTELACSGETGKRLFLNDVGGSAEDLKYNNYSTYMNFYLGSPFEIWLSGELTCTVGTQIALVFELYENMLYDSKYFCKQSVKNDFQGRSFHSWCWTEDGEVVFENMRKRLPRRKAQTGSEIHKRVSKEPTLCLQNSRDSLDVVECEQTNYDELYNSRTSTPRNATYEYLIH